MEANTSSASDKDSKKKTGVLSASSNSKNKKNKVLSISSNSKKKDGINDKALSENSTIGKYDNTLSNNENLESLKKNLLEGHYCEELGNAINKFLDEKKAISDIYKNEDNIRAEIEKNNAYKLNDDIFEEKILNIFSKEYSLKENDFYPYFNVGYSKIKKGNVIKVYYDQIEIKFDDKDLLCILFLDERENFMIKYKEYPMIFEKYEEEWNNVTVITNNYKSSIDFDFTKRGNILETSFAANELDANLIETKNNIKKTRNARDSSEKEEEKKKFDERLKSYSKILKIQTKIYGVTNTKNELEKKKNELEIFEEKIKLGELDDNSRIITNIKEEIKNLETKIKKYYIKIEKKDQEFDGFFIASKKIILSNSIGDTLTIPAKSPIIVEVKNFSKYSNIIDNIKKKIKLLKALGFNIDNFYFIGIMRGIDVDEEKKNQIDKKCQILEYKKNLIVIYPDKMNFMNTFIYENKKSIEPIKKEENKGDKMSELIQMVKNLFSYFENMKKDYDSYFENMKKDYDSLKNEIGELKADISAMKNRTPSK